MDAFEERLIVGAATIDELLSADFETLPGQKGDADLAARRLAAWCRSCASGDWSLFERRLIRDGLTIAVSESPNVSQIAKRTVLSTSALAVLAPILEEVAGWERYRIRSFFETNGMLIQEWERVRTDWLKVRPAAEPTPTEGVMAPPKLEAAN